MSSKAWSFIIIILNMLGVLCLVYFSIPYFLHDINVTNPEAMIPFQKWEASGFILTFGLIPLVVVNILAMIFVGNKKHRLIVRALFLFPCIVCLGIVGSFWLSEISSASCKDKVNDSSVQVVNVKVKTNETSEIQYALLYDDGCMELLDKAFDVDDVDVFTADINNFSTEIENNKVVNSLVSTVVKDGSGKDVEADAKINEMLNKLAATINHGIIEAKIFMDGDKYFVAVQTNVNLQSPCDFYVYDQTDGVFEKLCTWDDTEVLGIALPK